MSEHPNAAIVRSAYEAMEKGDMAAFAALLDDDIIWHEPKPGLRATTTVATRRWRCSGDSSRRPACSSSASPSTISWPVTSTP